MSNEINIEEMERLAKDLIHSAPWTDLYKDQTIAFEVTVTPNAILFLIDRMKKAEAELERERMRLAACGVVAMADTPESAAKAREMRDEYRSASCDDVARRVDECMTLRAERDALAAKLKDAEHDRDEFRRVMNGFAEKMAELEGQEPVQLDEPDYHWEAMGCGLEDRNITDRYEAMKHGWDCAMDRMFEQISEPLYARPVPAESVNARLLDALKRAKNSIVAFKFVPGGANCWEASDEENLTAVNSAIAAAEAAHTEPVNVDFGKRGENMFFKIDNQSFLLEYKPEEQDEFDFMKAMLLSAFSRITHGVKTEIQPVNTRLLTALKACRNKLAHDASMVAMADVAIMAAEAAPRVARLTEADVDICFGGSDGTRISAARAIETAALRKNGLALED